MFSNLNLYITIMMHATISFQRLVLKKTIFNISFLDHNYRKPLIRILKDSFVPFKIKGFGAIRGIYGHIFYEFQKILDQNFVSLLKKLFTPCCSFLILLWLICRISYNFADISMIFKEIKHIPLQSCIK